MDETSGYRRRSAPAIYKTNPAAGNDTARAEGSIPVPAWEGFCPGWRYTGGKIRSSQAMQGAGSSIIQQAF